LRHSYGPSRRVAVNGHIPFEGTGGGAPGPRSWWVAAGLIGLISILAFVGNLVNSDTPLEPLRLGVLFLPSYLHLACEVWWRAV
jgi:hypothetical protein